MFNKSFQKLSFFVIFFGKIDAFLFQSINQYHATPYGALFPQNKGQSLGLWDVESPICCCAVGQKWKQIVQ